MVPSQTRWVLLAMMLGALFMNAAIGRASDTTACAFVVPLLVIQLGRPAWTIGTAPTWTGS